jgi:hypothetical protein
VIGLAIRDDVDRSVHLPESRLAFDRPASWDTGDALTTFDASWAASQKQKYPDDAPLIDALVEGLASGDAFWFARVDVNGDRESDGWVLADVTDDDHRTGSVRAAAEDSVGRQPVQLRPGTTAIDVTLPAGPAVRLDWGYDLRLADGSTTIGTVRSYWIVDGSKLVAIQLTFYGEQPAVLASFEAAIQTLRWDAE